MLDELKAEAHAANLLLPEYGLVSLTWGNASAIDRQRGILAIKPSGVEYASLTAADMVLVDLEGQAVEAGLRPSSDTPTHVALYRALAGIGGVVHTHSRLATAFAQAGRPIPCFGTTHADHFHSEVPVTRPLTRAEVDGDYETNTGAVIAERFRGLDPLACPGVLVHSHGPFTWGADARQAAQNALVLELVADMALLTLALAPGKAPVDRFLLERHYRRKHGEGAYYGQGTAGQGPARH
jgi:L-ribulose-5-phosphate 4-epimerase